MKIDKEKKKSKAGAWITAAVILVVFAASFFYYYRHTLIRDAVLYENGALDLVYQIDDVTEEDDHYLIHGWCFVKDKNIDLQKLPEPRILLVDMETGNIQYFNAAYGLERTDIASYFNEEGYDYTYCGFETVIPLQRIDSQKSYEIAIQYDNSKIYAARTSTFLSSGELTYINPVYSESLPFEGTELEKIITEGTPRVFRPDLGIYVYQWDWKLYWIISSEYAYLHDGQNLCYNLSTTQRNRLPENRIEHGFDSRGWILTQEEISLAAVTEEYYCFVREIPETYAVTVISTGYYDTDHWVWKEAFYPHYF